MNASSDRRLVFVAVALAVAIVAVLAGCAEDTPRYQNQWNFIRANCTEAFPAGEARLDCVASGVERIMPPIIPPASGFACTESGPYKVCSK